MNPVLVLGLWGDVLSFSGGWIRRGSRVGLVWMRVCDELIQKDDPVILQYGDNWKKIIFTSRRRDPFLKEIKELIAKKALYCVAT